MLTYADGKEINKKTNMEAERWDERKFVAGGWNLTHLLPWQGPQSCVMLWSLKDGHIVVV